MAAHAAAAPGALMAPSRAAATRRHQQTARHTARVSSLSSSLAAEAVTATATGGGRGGPRGMRPCATLIGTATHLRLYPGSVVLGVGVRGARGRGLGGGSQFTHRGSSTHIRVRGQGSGGMGGGGGGVGGGGTSYVGGTDGSSGAESEPGSSSGGSNTGGGDRRLGSRGHASASTSSSRPEHRRRALGSTDGAGPDADGVAEASAFGVVGAVGGAAGGVGAEGTAAASAPTPSTKSVVGAKRARLKLYSRRVWRAWHVATGGVKEVDMLDAKGDPLPAYPVTAPKPDAGILNGRADLVSDAAAVGSVDEGGEGVAEMPKLKKRNFHLAVNPPKPHSVMRINSGTAPFRPGEIMRQALSRRALLRDAELTPRDLRRIDPSLLQTNNTPALLVSDQTILINLGVRLIIRPDHALLFEPDTATAKRFLEAVKARSRVDTKADKTYSPDDTFAGDRSLSHYEERSMEPENGHEILEGVEGLGGASVEGHDAHEGPSCPLYSDPADRRAAAAEPTSTYAAHMDYSNSYDMDMDNKTPGGMGGAPIPFELEVVEAALQETTSQLYAKLEFCEVRCKQVSARLQSSINPAVLEELRLVKQSLVRSLFLNKTPPNPESRIQNPDPESRIPNPESQILNPESRIPNPDPEFKKPDLRSQISIPRSPIPHP